MGDDRSEGNPQFGGDLLVLETPHHQPQHLRLAGRERLAERLSRRIGPDAVTVAVRPLMHAQDIADELLFALVYVQAVEPRKLLLCRPVREQDRPPCAAVRKTPDRKDRRPG